MTKINEMAGDTQAGTLLGLCNQVVAQGEGLIAINRAMNPIGWATPDGKVAFEAKLDRPMFARKTPRILEIVLYSLDGEDDQTLESTTTLDASMEQSTVLDGDEVTLNIISCIRANFRARPCRAIEEYRTSNMSPVPELSINGPKEEDLLLLQSEEQMLASFRTTDV